ncbi:response regulator transcription factor [Streptomyces pathocidini]|uniref:helix-turn-helix transcriptional regulator n=1 Tax=Streptomyces pathocidini TaxID=1650571 RepID=UPI0033FF1461
MIRAVIAIGDPRLRTRTQHRLAGAEGFDLAVLDTLRPDAIPALHGPPDAILLDSADAKGPAALGRWARAAPLAVFADTGDHEAITAALKAGARGILARDLAAAELAAAVLLVATGSCVRAPAAGRRTVADLVPPQRSWPLSPRETEVMGLLAEGLTNQQIAHSLYLSPTTVKGHVSTILRKLGVSNRVQAVALYSQPPAA